MLEVRRSAARDAVRGTKVDDQLAKAGFNDNGKRDAIARAIELFLARGPNYENLAREALLDGGFKCEGVEDIIDSIRQGLTRA